MEIAFILAGVIIGVLGVISLQIIMALRRSKHPLELPEFIVLKSTAKISKQTIVDLDELVSDAYSTYERTEELKVRVSDQLARRKDRLSAY